MDSSYSFPSPPIPVREKEADWLEAISSSEMLLAESVEMRNCAFECISQILVYIFKERYFCQLKFAAMIPA